MIKCTLFAAASMFSVQAWGLDYLVSCSESSYAQDLAKDALTEYQELAQDDPDSYAPNVELWPIYKTVKAKTHVAGYFLAVQEASEEWMLTDLYLCTDGDYFHFYVEDEAQRLGFWLHEGKSPRQHDNTVFQDEADMHLVIEPVNAFGTATIKFSLHESGAAKSIGSDHFQFQVPKKMGRSRSYGMIAVPRNAMLNFPE